MNHIKKTLIISLILLCGSCSEFLDRYPLDGIVADEFWRNKEDLKAVMIGAYSALADLDAHLFLLGELRADMLIGGVDIEDCNPGDLYGDDDDGKFHIQNIRSGDIIPNNNFAKWGKLYEVINYCNHVIKYAPIIHYERDDTFSEYYMNAYIAEATALRALVYFYLVRTYNDVPYITEPSETDLIDLFPAKTEGNIILSNIVQDLHANGLVENMADFYDDEITTKGRMCRFAGYALLAEIALWNSDYNMTITYTEKIENSVKYQYASNSGWFRMFSVGNSTESIFELQYDDIYSSSNKLYDLTRNLSNYYFYPSSTAEAYFVGSGNTSSDEGTRAEGSIAKEGSLVSYYNLYKIYKYIGTSAASKTFQGITAGTMRSSDNGGAANFIIYRLSDVMLMKAEALCQLGNLSDAMEIVNTIRLRADVPEYTANSFGTTIKTAELTILNERAIELAYEGKRWFDLLRYVRRDITENKDVFIEFISDNYNTSEQLVIASKLNDENSWFLPVHQDEMDSNPNMEQNPYYEGFE